MKYTIDELTSQSPREELVAFLANFENEKRGEDYWRRRLIFWWDENPSKPGGFPLGWVARQEGGAIVGFLAAIAFDYVYQGKIYPALDASTWRVLEAHRSISLPMFMKWHQLRERHVLLDTTPNVAVQRILERFQYCSVKIRHNYFFPLRQPGGVGRRLLFGAANRLACWSLPQRPLKLVSLMDDFTIRNAWIDFDRLEKRISREYLRWYCGWAEKEFIGCVDSDNVLTSYIILEPDHYGKYRVLSLIDHFTTRPDNTELLALIRHLLIRPASPAISGRHDFLMLNLLEDILGGKKTLGTFYRQNPGLHHYWLPGDLKAVAKRCVIAEGDYGC